MKKNWNLWAIALVFLVATPFASVGAETLSQEGAKAYIEVVKDYESRYGLGGEPLSEGLYQSRLLDFDGDGSLDLLLFTLDKVNEGSSLLGSIDLFSLKGNEVEPMASLSVSHYYHENEGSRYALVEEDSAWAIWKQELTAGAVTPFTEEFYRMEGERFQGTAGDYSIQAWEDFSVSTEFVIFQGEADLLCPVISALGELEAYALAVVEVPLEEIPEELPYLDAPQHQTSDYGSMERQYLEILQGYVADYGISDGSSQGLASSRLLDLDGNGSLELVLTLCTQTSPLALRFEVWEMVKDKATCTFVHSQGQKYFYQEDWRDKGGLYSYGGNWIFATTGGGGTAFFSSYDRIFAYENATFTLVDESYLMRVEGEERRDFVGYVTGQSVQKASGEGVSSALPTWYLGYERIQAQYFQGNAIDLYFIDKSGFSWVTDSVLTDLEVSVYHQGDWIVQGDVVIPQEHNLFSRYEAYEQQILMVEHRYGTSSGMDEGLAFSYLLDFTGDGQEDLLLGYCSKLEYFGRDAMELGFGVAKNNSFTLEIWSFQEEKAVLLWQTTVESQMPAQDEGETLVYGLGVADGVWRILCQQGGETLVLVYEDGEFVEEEDGGVVQVELLHLAGGSQLFWNSNSCRPSLQLALTKYGGSDHYYGHSVVFDSTLKENIAQAMGLRSSILALYEVEEGLYFAIVPEESRQQGYVFAKDDHGVWLCLAEGMLSAYELEEIRLSLSGEEMGSVAVPLLSPADWTEEGYSQEDVAVGYHIGVIVFAMTMGLWLLLVLIRRK